MSSPSDTADEVKVFRSSDVDEVGLDTAQSSQQLSEDKKDVAYEAEMDTPTSNLSHQNLFFNPALIAPSMFSQLPSTNNLMYPVFMQHMSPHYVPRLTSPFSLLSPHFATLAVNSPHYGRPNNGFAPTMAALMNPHSGLLAQNFQNQMNPQQTLQKLFAQHHQQMQNNMMKNSENVNPHVPTPKRERVQREKKDKNHIKKPCNAFMLYMRENRQKFSNGTVKQSSELNKEMGKAWHALQKEEQDKYFEKAKRAREDHAKLHPNWSARENYAINKKKRKKRERSQDPSGENNEQKKCRARFGIEQQALWCKHCKRKKRCLNVRASNSPPTVSSTTNPTTPTHPFASPASAMSSSMLSPTPFMQL